MWQSALFAIGTGMSIYGQIKAGKAAEEEAKYTAEQLRERAAFAEAASHREAAEALRVKERTLSKAVLSIVAQGGTTTDPGAVQALAELETEGEYNRLMALFNGHQTGRDMRTQADSVERSGEAAMDAAIWGAAASAISAGASVADRFKSAKTSDFQDWHDDMPAVVSTSDGALHDKMPLDPRTGGVIPNANGTKFWGFRKRRMGGVTH